MSDPIYMAASPAKEVRERMAALGILPGAEERPCSKCGAILLLAASSLEAVAETGAKIVCHGCVPTGDVTLGVTLGQLRDLQRIHERARRN